MVCVLSEKDGSLNWCERHRMYHDAHYSRYAVDPGPKGESFRALWDKQANNDPTLPTRTKRLLNYFSSLKEHVTNGSVMVDDKEKVRRRKKCDGCQFRN